MPFPPFPRQFPENDLCHMTSFSEEAYRQFPATPGVGCVIGDRNRPVAGTVSDTNGSGSIFARGGSQKIDSALTFGGTAVSTSYAAGSFGLPAYVLGLDTNRVTPTGPTNEVRSFVSSLRVYVGPLAS
ncbi:hypothetical protein KL86DPRO_10875 [uncultured delta proteobacterium]|uniref:Uncharacterized protein n=1 Tax=uncultured delta proteobacterium TaxID=34034 RepID=A0A212J7R3_9DELT|nr:hypothetical protein KL86DPRO_10875 [uncultured delta proteobacterium]